MYNQIVSFIKTLYAGTEGTIPLHAPCFAGNEKRYLEACIDSTFVSSVGKFVDRFEEMVADYTGAARAVVCVNGTNALHIALLLAGVKQYDEVITQPLTFIATANAISYIGARPVFLDVDSLKQTSAENLARRRQLAAQSRQMLDEAVEESWHWLAACAVDRPIQTLRQQVQQVESDTADLLCARLELSDRQQKLLRKLLHAGMNRLLRQPIRQLKELENEQDQARLAQAIDYLFNTAEE